MVWKEVEGSKNFWNPTKEGEQIVGKLVGIEDGMYGKKYTMQIVRDGKEEMINMPSHKVLQGKLSACAIGEPLRVTFKGTEPPKARGENPTRIYSVQRDEPDEEQVH